MSIAFLNSVFCEINPPGAFGTSTGLQPLERSETLYINLLNILFNAPTRCVVVINLRRIDNWSYIGQPGSILDLAPNEDSGYGASNMKKTWRGKRYWMDGLSC
jgi:hypothetical protein